MELSTILTDYFVVIVFVGCLVMGYILKNSTIFKWINNKDIPAILAVLGAIINCIVNGISVLSIIAGAFTGLASTGAHQMFKKYVEKFSQKNNEEE